MTTTIPTPPPELLSAIAEQRRIAVTAAAHRALDCDATAAEVAEYAAAAGAEWDEQHPTLAAYLPEDRDTVAIPLTRFAQLLRIEDEACEVSRKVGEHIRHTGSDWAKNLPLGACRNLAALFGVNVP